MRQPGPMRVAPRSRTSGSMVTSAATLTPSSQRKRAGSSSVTPAFISAEARRPCSTCPARASSSRSLTPEASSGSTSTATAGARLAVRATRSVR